MAYVLAPDRVTLEIEDGPAVEVGPLLSWAVLVLAGERYAKYIRATEPVVALAALRDLFELVVAHAQPTFQVLDHLGPIPPTADGMLRFPLSISLKIVEAWIGTAEEKATAADAMLPDGPVKDTINLALRRKRKAA